MKRGVVERKGRPQDPVAPLPYREEMVMVSVKQGVTLAGTLAIPGGDKQAAGWPAVVLVSGSGPQNRDKQRMGQRPQLVLADRLARAGIAVLRYDERGMGLGTADFGTATTGDFSVGAEAAWKWLGNRPQVRKDAAGIAGHAEGGLVAAMVAGRESGAGFVVLQAGPGVNGREVMLAGFEGIIGVSGVSPREVERQVKV